MRKEVCLFSGENGKSIGFFFRLEFDVNFVFLLFPMVITPPFCFYPPKGDFLPALVSVCECAWDVSTRVS